MKTETPTKLINLVFAIFYEEEVVKINTLYSKVCDELSNIEFVGDEDQPFYDLICNRITKKIIELLYYRTTVPSRGILSYLLWTYYTIRK